MRGTQTARVMNLINSYTKSEGCIRQKICKRKTKSSVELLNLIKARKAKKDNVARNVKRIDAAKKAVEKSRLEIDNLTTNDKRIKDEQHRAKVREPQKAEDAIRQCLEAKRSMLAELLEKLSAETSN